MRLGRGGGGVAYTVDAQIENTIPTIRISAYSDPG